jgi:hypothetical protein
MSFTGKVYGKAPYDVDTSKKPKRFVGNAKCTAADCGGEFGVTSPHGLERLGIDPLEDLIDCRWCGKATARIVQVLRG